MSRADEKTESLLLAFEKAVASDALKQPGALEEFRRAREALRRHVVATRAEAFEDAAKLLEKYSGRWQVPNLHPLAERVRRFDHHKGNGR